MNDRQLLQQALDAMRRYQVKRQDFDTFANEITTLNERLAHCDRCGKRLGGEGDIHTCTPDPIGDAQDRLIAELAAQPAPVQKPVATMRMLHTYGDTTPPAAPKTEFEEAVEAVDSTLHHAIDHWQDKASEQAALLRECRFAIDILIKKQPALAMTLCGSTTLGNLKASLHDYRVLFDNAPPAAQRTWVGLTDAELADMHATLMVKLRGCYETKDLYRAIEAKLKEKNT